MHKHEQVILDIIIMREIRSLEAQEGRNILFLTRKVGEKIMIGDNVEVLVMDISGGHVRIGIAAPENVSVDREEVRQNKIYYPDFYDQKMADRDRNR